MSVKRSLGFFVVWSLLCWLVGPIMAEAQGKKWVRVDTVVVVDTITIPVDTFYVRDTVTVVRVDTVPRVCPICPSPTPPPDTTTPPPPPPPPSGGTNEPSGMARIAEWSGSPMPPTNGSTTFSGTNLGRWTYYPFGSATAVTVSDASAPSADGKAFETTYPAGMRSGTEPVEIGGWSGGSVRRLYWRAWVKYVANGGTWEAHPDIQKAGFFAYGCGVSGTARNDGYLALNAASGAAVGTLVSRFRWSFIQQNNVNRALYSSGTVEVGKWQLWEILLTLNTLGSANGTLTMWLDGVQVGRWTDMKYITPGCEAPFNYYKWRATWGGNKTGLTRARTDRVRFDHIYLSGSN